MQYRCIATSVEGFVQQIACSYLRHGYWWYVTGCVPDRKDPEQVDDKLLRKYDVVQTEWRRARRKELGQANMQYLRYDRQFILLATVGRHSFFEQESGVIRDFRRSPLRFHGYAISYRRGGRLRSGERDPKWHAHVEIGRRTYLDLKAWFVDRAVNRNPESLAEELKSVPFEPYAPVRRQMLNILRAVNRRRKLAGFEQLPSEVLRLRRRIVRPFEPPELDRSRRATGPFPRSGNEM